jgi:hypothetical protein
VHLTVCGLPIQATNKHFSRQKHAVSETLPPTQMEFEMHFLMASWLFKRAKGDPDYDQKWVVSIMLPGVERWYEDLKIG